MKISWLITASKFVVKGSKAVMGVVAAVHAVEAMSNANGKAKEDEAVQVLPPILSLAGLGDKASKPEVQEAIRKTMQAYVAAQDARVAAKAAADAFEAAKEALDAAIAAVR